MSKEEHVWIKAFNISLFILAILFGYFILESYITSNEKGIQFAVAMETLLMALFVALQTMITRKAVEQAEKQVKISENALLYPLKREHTLELREKVIEPLLSLFKEGIEIYHNPNPPAFAVYVKHIKGYSQSEGKIKLFWSKYGSALKGSENLSEVSNSYAGLSINENLLEDFIENHVPVLKQLYNEFIMAIFELNNPIPAGRKKTLIEILKQLKKDIIAVLEEAKATEIFLDECLYVKGTTKEYWQKEVPKKLKEKNQTSI